MKFEEIEDYCKKNNLSIILIVLYNEDRLKLARSWNLQIQAYVDDYSSHVNVIALEDLSNFLGLNSDANKELLNLMKLKNKCLRGYEDAFQALIDLKDKARISLTQMKVNQNWFDMFLGSR